MDLAQHMKETSFHDSSIASMQLMDGQVRIVFEDVYHGDDRYRVIVDFTGVSKVTRDGQHVDSMDLEAEDPEVGRLERSNGVARISFHWRRPTARTDGFCAYAFRYGAHSLRYEPDPWPDQSA